MYALGEGVPQNDGKAFQWYVQAANRQYSRSQADAELALGELYAHGLGVAQDYRIASAWYQIAATHGSGDAGLELADLYER